MRTPTEAQRARALRRPSAGAPARPPCRLGAVPARAPALTSAAGRPAPRRLHPGGARLVPGQPAGGRLCRLLPRAAPTRSGLHLLGLPVGGGGGGGGDGRLGRAVRASSAKRSACHAGHAMPIASVVCQPLFTCLLTCTDAPGPGPAAQLQRARQQQGLAARPLSGVLCPGPPRPRLLPPAARHGQASAQEAAKSMHSAAPCLVMRAGRQL